MTATTNVLNVIVRPFTVNDDGLGFVLEGVLGGCDRVIRVPAVEPAQDARVG